MTHEFLLSLFFQSDAVELLLLIASSVFETQISIPFPPSPSSVSLSSSFEKWREWTSVWTDLYRSQKGWVTVRLLARLFELWNVYILSDSSLESLQR